MYIPDPNFDDYEPLAPPDPRFLPAKARVLEMIRDGTILCDSYTFADGTKYERAVDAPACAQ